jgi:hypothetical protein
MKAIFFVALIMLATFFTACEKNDYQHPGHRSGKY